MVIQTGLPRRGYFCGMSNQEEQNHIKEIIVDPGQTMVRLDKFILEKIEKVSRNRIQKGN